MTIVYPITPRDVYYFTLATIPELALLSRVTLLSFVEGFAHVLWTSVLSPTITAYSILAAHLRGCKDIIIDVVPELPPVGKILQSLWTITHASTLVSTITYFYYKLCRERFWAKCSYFLAGTSMLATYCLVTYRHSVLLISRRKQVPRGSSKSLDNPLIALLKSENTFLLVMSVLILLSQENGFKIVSFFIYSSMNIVSHILFEWFPDGSLSAAMTPLFSYFEESLLLIAATSDVMVNGIYLYECTYTDSKCQFVIYLTVFLLRLESSETCREAVSLFLLVFRSCFTLAKRSVGFEVAASDSHEASTVPPLAALLADLTTHDIKESWQLKLAPFSTKGVREISTSDYPNLRKRDRIASLVFDSFSVVNDLIQE